MKVSKSKIKKALLAKQETVIENLRKMIDELRESSDMDEDDSASIDDFSQVGEVDAMTAKMEDKLEGAIKSLNALQELSLEENDTVDLGALVETDSLNFFISMALPSLKVEDMTIHSISTHSPIYQALEGKKKGDTAEFNGRKYKIKAIH